MAAMLKKVQFKVPEKVTSLFQPSKCHDPPMFNRPMASCCPHHRISRTLYVIFLTLLVLISTPVITLKAMTYNFIEENRDRGFVFETTEPDDQAGIAVIMAALPRMLHQAPAKLALVASVLSICLGLAHLGFVGIDWRSGKRTQSWAFRRNIMFLHISNSILILFALVSIFVTHRNTSHFRDGYVNFYASRVDDDAENTENFFRYSIGTFDLETWACELKDVRGATMVQDDYRVQCTNELASRALMIPFLIIAWLVAGICIWGLVGGGRRGPDGERVKTEEVGLEMGKMNAL